MNIMRGLWIGRIRAVVVFVDVMSVLDTYTHSRVRYRFFVWAGNYIYLGLFLGLVFWYEERRASSILREILRIPILMVRRSKLMFLGGSALMMSSLFITLFAVNVVGGIPYALSMSSHLVFRVGFAVPFWLGLLLSGVISGGLAGFLSGLVFKSTPVFGGWAFCCVEVLRIFLRWITLSVRLRANMTIGQILMGFMGTYTMVFYDRLGYWWLPVVLLSAGVGLQLVEVAVGFIQSYVFCMLLRIYSNEHRGPR